MSRYHSNKWFVEILRYLLPPDAEIVTGGGSLMVHCNGVNWEVDETGQAEWLANVLREIQKQGGKQ